MEQLAASHKQYVIGNVRYLKIAIATILCSITILAMYLILSNQPSSHTKSDTESSAEVVYLSVVIQLPSWDLNSIKKSMMTQIPGIEDVRCDPDGFTIIFEKKKYHWDLQCPQDGDETGWRTLIWTAISTLLGSAGPMH